MPSTTKSYGLKARRRAAYTIAAYAAYSAYATATADTIAYAAYEADKAVVAADAVAYAAAYADCAVAAVAAAVAVIAATAYIVDNATSLTGKDTPMPSTTKSYGLKARRLAARCAAIGADLSDDARHFLRCNPGADGSPFTMQALKYMDDCAVDAEYAGMKALEEQHAKDIIKERQAIAEEFRELIDAALYAVDQLDDEDNLRDLEREARRLDKYVDNIMDK